MKLIALAVGVFLVLALVYLVRRGKRAKAVAAVPLPDEYSVALGYYDAGQLAEAEAALRQVIAARPGFAEAHFKLGNVLADGGRLDEAEAAYRQALRCQPDFHQVHNNLGNLQRFTGRPAEAEASFRRAIDCQADFPDAHSNLGIVLAEAGRHGEAEEAFRQALRSHPARFDVLYNLAQLLEDLGRSDEAEEAYRQALRLNREFFLAVNALGLLLAKNGRAQEAQTYFRDALRLNPGFPQAYHNLGLALADGGQLDEAEAVYRQALAVHATNVDILADLAGLLAKTRRTEEAEAAYRQALGIQPGRPEILHNLGSLYLETGRPQEAHAAFQQALAIAPNQPETLNDLGALYMQTGRPQQAQEAYQRALAVSPGQPRVLRNLAALSLLQGHLEQGWEGMEYRWQTEQKHEFRGFSQPCWDGKAFAGKTLLVHYEQGAGDSIQFFRYLPGVAALGGRLVVECPVALFRLFRENLPAEVRLIRYQKDALPDFDLYCPLLSLPLYLQTRLETVPAGVPYLKLPAEAVASCPPLPALPGAPVKVGLVWAGNPLHGNDHNRSLDFSLLEPLLATPGITWVILQMERRPPGFDRLAAQNGWLDPLGQVKDFADTAAIVSQLDLVIGVDTSVIHLAGALGKPVWLLLPLGPDWRWLLEREDSPWYPTMRLFRQSEYRDWPAVVRRVAAALPAERDALMQAKALASPSIQA